MLMTDNNKAFGLDEIDKIRLYKRRFQKPYYEISFKNDHRKLYACDYHAFVNDINIPIKTSELKKGDFIWVDISAFSSDKSFK